jgi:hypothetical protein
LIPRSKPNVRPSPLPVHRHDTSSLTFTLLSTTISVLYTCTSRAKRHAHIAFAMVGLVTTQPTSWITLTITHHKTNTQGYLSTLCSQRVISGYFGLVCVRVREEGRVDLIFVSLGCRDLGPFVAYQQRCRQPFELVQRGCDLVCGEWGAPSFLEKILNGQAPKVIKRGMRWW